MPNRSSNMTWRFYQTPSVVFFLLDKDLALIEMGVLGYHLNFFQRFTCKAAVCILFPPPHLNGKARMAELVDALD